MTLWTPAMDAGLQRLASLGESFSFIGAKLGVTKDAAQKRIRRLGMRGEVRTVPNPPEVDGLRPLLLPSPFLDPTKTVDVETTVVAGDFHFGPDTYSPECEQILLHVVADVRPGTIVLNGDLPDLLAVSRYPKDFRYNHSLTVEKQQMHEFLHRLMQASPNTRIVETNANHSGDGVESRWSRYLSDRIPEAMADPGFALSVSYTAQFHPAWCPITLVDYHVICPGLIALHGDIVRGHAAYSARAMLEKWRISLIHGHTHRFGHYGYRVPAIAGKREHQMRAWEGGCMCRVDAPYLATTNWHQGFSIVRHNEDGLFGVEQVSIQEGAAVVVTAGQSYRAAA